MPMPVIEKSIWINAPRERVWRAITDPQQLAQWFTPGTPWSLSALEVGGTLTAHAPDEETTFSLDVVDPPHEFTTRSAEMPPMITTWTLEEENNGTRVTVRYSGVEAAPGEDPMGMAQSLENLAAYLDGKPLPHPEG